MVALAGLSWIEVSDAGGEDEFEPEPPQPKASESRIAATENALSRELKYREVFLWGMAVPSFGLEPCRVALIPRLIVLSLSRKALSSLMINRHIVSYSLSPHTPARGEPGASAPGYRTKQGMSRGSGDMASPGRAIHFEREEPRGAAAPRLDFQIQSMSAGSRPRLKQISPVPGFDWTRQYADNWP